MKRYRLVDSWWEPYYTGYNETDLKELAYSIWSLWDWDWAWEDEAFYWKTREEQIDKIYSLLESWERDLLYFVEESDEPFENLWYDDADDEVRMENWKEVIDRFNYTRKAILDYAKTRKDLWEYDDDRLVMFVWDYSGYWGSSKKPISEILDEFSMINWREELDDYLNNILFDTYDEVLEAIKKWFEKEKWVSRDKEVYAELASQFIDNKELYDLSYD